VVFLTLTKLEPERYGVQIHLVRPGEMQQSHMFKVFIHIDIIEDLSFYHFPCEELVADGKIP
jgi:hypothetical protein